MNGKFNEIDKQDLIKRGFSEDNIFYLENLDSTEKKGLYLKICEVIDSGITAEQVMEKVKNTVQSVSNTDLVEEPTQEQTIQEPEQTIQEPEPTIQEPEPTIQEPEPEPTIQEPEPTIQEQIDEQGPIEEDNEEPLDIQKEEVIEEVIEGGKTKKNRNNKKKRKSRKSRKSRKGKRTRKGRKVKKGRKTKHHK